MTTVFRSAACSRKDTKASIMTSALVRKAQQVFSDPVLRRWLIGRAIGRRPPEPPFTPHVPPYLQGVSPLAGGTGDGGQRFEELAAGRPTAPLELPLPGETIRVSPGEERVLFKTRFADTETLLALHRFAWIPLLGDKADPAWVQALWTAWRETHGVPGDGWAWHPYTAAERAVNILAFGRRHGLPAPIADTVQTLCAHGPAIAERLEYFGEHNTSNHLSNNGRGLYLLGLELGLVECSHMGARLLIEEAKRIFLPSGILREGSSHYHLLITRNYLEAWLAARAHGRPEAATLESIAARALAAVRELSLPGGMPLVGDISPDCPPAFLDGLRGGGGGWVALLEATDRDALAALQGSVGSVSHPDLKADGWLRAEFGPWTGLWHAAPAGWSSMPGHGHQDIGGFEVHFGAEPVFIDIGRGAYGETGAAAHARSGRAHNTLLVDGLDPYPPNRPYYDDRFRRRTAGPPPVHGAERDGVFLRHTGYSRLPDVGAVERRWSFSDASFSIFDRVEGSGRHRFERLLHTSLPVMQTTGGVVIHGIDTAYRVTADGHLSFEPANRWRAYGMDEPATVIRVRNESALPFQAALKVEAL